MTPHQIQLVKATAPVFKVCLFVHTFYFRTCALYEHYSTLIYPLFFNSKVCSCPLYFSLYHFYHFYHLSLSYLLLQGVFFLAAFYITIMLPPSIITLSHPFFLLIILFRSMVSQSPRTSTSACLAGTQTWITSSTLPIKPLEHNLLPLLMPCLHMLPILITLVSFFISFACAREKKYSTQVNIRDARAEILVNISQCKTFSPTCIKLCAKWK